jgi:hypothetical protein
MGFILVSFLLTFYYINLTHYRILDTHDINL